MEWPWDAQSTPVSTCLRSARCCLALVAAPSASQTVDGLVSKVAGFPLLPFWLTASLFDSIAIRCRSDVHHFFRRCSTLLIRVTRVKVKKENPRRLPLERQSTDSTGAPDDEGSSFWGVALPLIIWRRADAPLLRAGEFDSGG